jgi:hypothetical protein
MNILWLLQDYASASENEEKTLMESVAVPRVIGIMSSIN